MLPEKDGFEVCREIRKTSDIPVIMLTARGEVTDRVVGLEIGADDYLPKPFEPRELVARIQNILRRRLPSRDSGSDDDSNGLLEFENLVVDLHRRSVTVNGKAIELTSMEYQLLALLATSPGRDFSLVSRLRQKLKPLEPIKTVWGAGYAFIGRSK